MTRKNTAKTADEFLTQAAAHMTDRASAYDQPSGERSANKTAEAFNAITGHNLTGSDIWQILLLLKLARQHQSPSFHRDSAEDAVAYAALMAEDLAKEE